LLRYLDYWDADAVKCGLIHGTGFIDRVRSAPTLQVVHRTFE
jgi:hypothetical protein